jgi:hypothetical protein
VSTTTFRTGNPCAFADDQRRQGHSDVQVRTAEFCLRHGTAGCTEVSVPTSDPRLRAAGKRADVYTCWPPEVAS